MPPTFGGHRASAATDEDDEIRLIHDCASLRRAAVGADDTHCQWMEFIDRPFAADGGGDGRRDPFREFEEILLRARDHDPPAADKAWAGGVAQQSGRALNKMRIRSDTPCRTADEAGMAPNVGPLHGAVLHIEG